MRKSFALLFILAFLGSFIVNSGTVFSSGDLVEDSWVSKAPMQEARSGLGVATVNGKIYAIGGLNSSGFVPSSPGSAVYAGKTPVAISGSNEEYNPATDTWTTKAPMLTPRAVFAIAVYQNKIYCIGGKADSGYTGVNEVYDPATDTWENKKSMPTARAFLYANIVNDKIYLIGGHRIFPEEFLLLNEVYDPQTDTWTTKKPVLSRTFFGYASATLNDKIYIVGGISQENERLTLNQIYDTETDKWSYGASPPIDFGGIAAGITQGSSAPKRMYVFGREKVGIYDPKLDSWIFGAHLLTNRYLFGAANLNDTFYAVGGHTYHFTGDYAPVSTNEQYIPLGYGAFGVESPIDNSQPEPEQTDQKESFPTYTVAASSASAIAISASIFVYLKKHRH